MISARENNAKIQATPLSNVRILAKIYLGKSSTIRVDYRSILSYFSATNQQKLRIKGVSLSCLENIFKKIMW